MLKNVLCQKSIKRLKKTWYKDDHVGIISMECKVLNLLVFSVKQPKRNTVTSPSELHYLLFFHLTFSVQSLTL